MTDSPSVRCGVLLDFRNPAPWRRPWPELYSDTLDFVARADVIGVDEVWLTEHHFVDDGYLASLLVAGAGIATRTTRIRIGTWVLLLPLHNAIRIAEDAVTLDVLSAGRLDLGVGLGYRELEFETLGIDRSERRGRMEEGFEVLRGLLRSGQASFDGDFYSFEDITLGIEPAQEPFPLWMGARSEPAARRAARMGAHLMLAGPPEVYDAYASTLVELGRDPSDFRLAYRMRVVPTDEPPERVLKRFRPHVEYGFGRYADWYAAAGDLTRDSDRRNWEDMATRDEWIIGPPEHCVEEISRRRGTLPITDLIAMAVEPGMAPADLLGPLERLVGEVMPGL